jgi:hypothetical protein
MTPQEARHRHGELVKEAGDLERLEDRRDLTSYEWSRLCGIYREIREIEQLLARCQHG